MSVFFINPFFFEAGADFESIATVTVGSGGASSIEFTSIPGTYQHLQVRGIIRNSVATSANSTAVRVNSDTGSNYTYHELYGTGATAGASGGASQTSGFIANYPAANATATAFAGIVLDLLDYASTSKNKTFRVFSGYDLNGSGQVRLASSAWLSTSAVTSLTLLPGSGNFVQHSTVALFGLRAP